MSSKAKQSDNSGSKIFAKFIGGGPYDDIKSILDKILFFNNNIYNVIKIYNTFIWGSSRLIWEVSAYAQREMKFSCV
jgi:hypothetical protein